MKGSTENKIKKDVENLRFYIKDTIKEKAQHLKQAKRIRNKVRKGNTNGARIHIAEMTVTLLLAELEALKGILKEFSYKYLTDGINNCETTLYEFDLEIKKAKDTVDNYITIVHLYEVQKAKIKKRMEVYTDIYNKLLQFEAME
jgi:hypothetical protein